MKMQCTECEENYYVTKRNLVLPFVCAECENVVDEAKKVLDNTRPMLKQLLDSPTILKALKSSGYEVDFDAINKYLANTDQSVADATGVSEPLCEAGCGCDTFFVPQAGKYALELNVPLAGIAKDLAPTKTTRAKTFGLSAGQKGMAVVYPDGDPIEATFIASHPLTVSVEGLGITPAESFKPFLEAIEPTLVDIPENELAQENYGSSVKLSTESESCDTASVENTTLLISDLESQLAQTRKDVETAIQTAANFVKGVGAAHREERSSLQQAISDNLQTIHELIQEKTNLNEELAEAQDFETKSNTRLAQEMERRGKAEFLTHQLKTRVFAQQLEINREKRKLASTLQYAGEEIQRLDNKVNFYRDENLFLQEKLSEARRGFFSKAWKYFGTWTVAR